MSRKVFFPEVPLKKLLMRVFNEEISDLFLEFENSRACPYNHIRAQFTRKEKKKLSKRYFRWQRFKNLLI